MDSSKFLILGANGQLGSALRQKYPQAKTATHDDLDITNIQHVEKYDWSKVAVILNAAAYTNVDGAETAEGRVTAWQTNAVAPSHLANVASKQNLVFVHISTEYVFDGTIKNHSEDEPFSPLSAYGATKAAGDIAASAADKLYILRTSWLIGEGKNFVRTMLELGQKGTSPAVVADQVGRPTFTTELANAIDHLLSHQSPYGVYNASNSGDPVSWADLTRAIFNEAGFNLQVIDTTTANYFASKPGSAPRPANSTLNLAKIEDAGFKPTDWHLNLREYIRKELRMENV